MPREVQSLLRLGGHVRSRQQQRADTISYTTVVKACAEADTISYTTVIKACAEERDVT